MNLENLKNLKKTNYMAKESINSDSEIEIESSDEAVLVIQEKEKNNKTFYIEKGDGEIGLSNDGSSFQIISQSGSNTIIKEKSSGSISLNLEAGAIGPKGEKGERGERGASGGIDFLPPVLAALDELIGNPHSIDGVMSEVGDRVLSKSNATIYEKTPLSWEVHYEMINLDAVSINLGSRNGGEIYVLKNGRLQLIKESEQTAWEKIEV